MLNDGYCGKWIVYFVREQVRGFPLTIKMHYVDFPNVL